MIITKIMKKKKEKKNKEEPKKTHSYSEIIVNQIIKKIISLVITNSIKNQIINQIPNYCFQILKESIDTLTYLDFLVYDKDDIEIKHKLITGKDKSSINIQSKAFFMKDKEKSLNNSEIIRKYKFAKKMDPKTKDECSIDIDIINEYSKEEKESKNFEKTKDEEKLVMKFLVREKYEDKKTSFEVQEEKKRKKLESNNRKYNFTFNDDEKKIFREICSGEIDPFHINPEEKIEIIKKVEDHKIDLLPKYSHKLKKEIPFDTKKESTNFWNAINQPLAPSIDRDAGTKIKYQKPKISFSKKISKLEKPDKNMIKEESNTCIRKINSSNRKQTIFNFQKNDNKKNKKKKYVQMEFESTDIDPKKFDTYYETTDAEKLRQQLKQKIKEKKIELEKIAQKEREKKARLDEIEERRKELSKKNMTTDIKGEIVFIKPLDIRVLNEEFKKGKSTIKVIRTIENEVNYIKSKKNLTVEKNPMMGVWDFKDDKNKKKNIKKKRDSIFYTKTTPNQNIMSAISSHSKKNEQPKNINLFDRSFLRFASGSNFSIINPSIGVNITEEKKVKSGGKDYFKKYNKYSLEIFQDQLNKTAASGFFPKLTEQINPNKNTNINDKNKKKRSSIYKQKMIKEIERKIIENLPPEENNILSLKTKNLKIALENLDLIPEQTEKEIYNSHKQLTNRDVIKKKMNQNEQIKNDYNEMNVFAKTLMGSQNWGSEIYSESRKKYKSKVPTKPQENELQREMPINLLKHMPRKRLPPISNSFRLNTLSQISQMGHTSTGFLTNRKNKKFKLEMDEIKKITKDEKK